MIRERRFGTADAAMIVTTFFWGLNAVISKNAVGDAPEAFRVFVYNGLRIPAGTLLLFITLMATGEKIGVERKHIPYLAVLSFFGMFMFMVAFILGISLTSSANTGVIQAMTPLLILIVSVGAGIEHIAARIAAGIAVGACGMIVLTLKRGGISFNAGDLLLLISCLAWAIHTVYGKKMLNFYSPMVTIAWVYFFTSIYQLPLALYQMKDQVFSEVAAINWFTLPSSFRQPVPWRWPISSITMLSIK